MNDKRNYEIELQTSLINSGQFPTCTNCEEWNKKAEVCGKYNTRPPAEIIVTGCVNWMVICPF